MAKYTPREKEELAEAGSRLGLGRRNPKVAELRLKRSSPTPQHENQTPPKKRIRIKESEDERVSRMIQQYRLKHLSKTLNIEPYDVTKPDRYPAVTIESAGNLALERILKRYEYVMKPQGITPADFKVWREQFMMMTPEQLGALIRVAGRTVRHWESGESRIPFSMWWVMHTTMQDPEYFLTRPGFHDFYIEYVDGLAHLCSRTYPDIRWTATDLYFNRCALNEVLSLRAEIATLNDKIQEMVGENTKLRQALKTKGVSAELQAMHEHIGEMMRRIQTADLLHIDVQSGGAIETPPITKAA